MLWNIVKRILWLMIGLILACAVASGAFLIYADLANRVEVERVKVAIRRDCAIEIDIDPSDIAEPGVVMKDYVSDDTPMRLICQGSIDWACTCVVITEP